MGGLVNVINNQHDAVDRWMSAPFPLRCAFRSDSSGVWPFQLGAWRVLRPLDVFLFVVLLDVSTIL